MGLFFNFSVALFSALGSCVILLLHRRCGSPASDFYSVRFPSDICPACDAHGSRDAHAPSGYDSGIIGSVVSKNFDQFQLFFHNPSDNITGAIVSTVRYLPRSSTALISPATLVRRRMLLRRRSRGLARLSHWTQTHHTARRARCVSGMQPAEFLRSDAQWRVPLAIQIAPALLLFLGMFVLPYSPRWLVDQDRIDEAHKVVQQLHESSHNKEFVDLEFAEMLEQIRYEQTHYSTKFSDLWATTPMLRRTLTGMAVQICTQFTGINVASYFQPTLFANLGLSGPRILLLTGINGALGAVVILIFIYFIIDRVGRKPPLIIGALGMALCLAIEAAINAKWGGADANNPVAQKTGVAFIFVCLLPFFTPETRTEDNMLFTSFFFGISFGPISWVYQSEIFPMRIRAVGTAVCTCANWACNVLISQVSPLGMSRLKYKFYILFVCTNVANALIVLFFFPETKGKSLEEMDVVFGDQVIPHALETKQVHNVDVEVEGDEKMEARE
ncbi:General substrate transporter [Mycena kentingensis (nom. inval.)]|nr:General substrate transporter [Mycena kentingensis (nom. inval.)]